MTKGFSFSLERVIALHKKIAKNIKEYENLTTELLPAELLNEFKYALRAVLECEVAREKKDEERFRYQEERAYHALHCMYHDLLDGLSIDLTERLDELSENYLEEIIDVLGATRQDIILTLNEVQKLIAKSRENIENREEIYEVELYQKHFHNLLEHRKTLQNSLDPIITLYKKRKKKSIIQWTITITSLFIAVVSLFSNFLL
jgi:hypothetical protein